MSVETETFTDRFGQAVLLHRTQRAAILGKHPETRELMDQLAIVLADPDEVRRSVRREDCVLYYRHDSTVLGGKWMVVVVKHASESVISTFYVTDRIKSGETIWTK